ncbi:hypothetical protein ANO11243_053380 [Dothideomycetidae sp. 11243]|nr:hypothetical protein ANO11243_053380 [fungal sp. No.11243]
MVLPNDARGWIMTAISGVAFAACVLGASIICADVIICRLPGMKGFRIQDSDSFLSGSLSLSFGVMLFSATYKMLPSAKTSLEDGGMSSKAASWVLIVCFLAGAVIIQIASRVLHHYIPSHVVNCEHSHDESTDDQKEHRRDRSSSQGFKRMRFTRHKSQSLSNRWPTNGPEAEAQTSYFTDDAPEQPFPPTPETTRETTRGATRDATRGATHGATHGATREDTFMTSQTRRPSLQNRLMSTFSKLSGSDRKCDSDGPCHGFKEPCGQECFKIVQARGSSHGHSVKSIKNIRRTSLAAVPPALRHTESTPLLGEIRERTDASSTNMHSSINGVSDLEEDDDDDDHSHQHHHHVPNNAFLSIGLQTSLAIALHKLPEGFITYATNHANPQLGFSVFLALFIHNITEGFALALPLYLALRSRWKAMMWAFLLGGCSQPLGAAIAALWFHIAGNTEMAPGERVYGGMFAATSGIMASVALQLFSESLDLTHNRNLCMIFAFLGMGIMGMSNALTA